MKLAKLSLAAITVASLSASAFAADSLAGMFKEGTIHGTLSAYYFNRNKPTAKSTDGTTIVNSSTSANILDFGLDLTYKTATFNGFSAGATVQSTHSPFANDAAKAMYSGDMYGSGEVFSEAYLQYVNSGFFVKAGRQYISTPLVAGSGSRMTKQSFEGYLLGYTGLPNTTLVAGYVYLFQGRTTGGTDSAIGTFTHDFAYAGNLQKGAYTLYAVNTSIPGLKLQAQWGDAVDVANLYYVQADYASKTDSFSYGLSGQFNVTDYDTKVSSKNSGYYGLMADIGVGPVSFSAAYSKIKSDANAVPGLGYGADNIFTAGDINTGDDYAAGQKTYKLQVGYKINKDSHVYGYYVNADMPNADAQSIKALSTTPVTYSVSLNSDYTGYGLGAGYKFEGTLKGLGMTAQYEVRNAKLNNISDDKRFRFKAIYSF
ncbi:MAG: OprD family outer membrane porin [Sulfurospirillaceae bacterium]|nr:OprD family outer membrane porin [Sulfurospirillaceae bacterium]